MGIGFSCSTPTTILLLTHRPCQGYIAKDRKSRVIFIVCLHLELLKKVSPNIINLDLCILDHSMRNLCAYSTIHHIFQKVILQRQIQKGGLANTVENVSSKRSSFTDDELRDCFNLNEDCKCDTKRKTQWDEYEGIETLKKHGCSDLQLLQVADERKDKLVFVHISTDSSFTPAVDSDNNIDDEESRGSGGSSDEFEFEDGD